MEKRISFAIQVIRFGFVIHVLLAMVVGLPRQAQDPSESDLITMTINRRRSYYPSSPVARFFENKLVFKAANFEKSIFGSLDINHYFFASHPRETVYHGPEIINFTLLPLVFVGMFNQSALSRLGWKLLLGCTVVFSFTGLGSLNINLLAIWPLGAWLLSGVNSLVCGFIGWRYSLA